jgi:hypothetical protein
MAENKYDHLFISGADAKTQASRPMPAIGMLDGKTFEGCNEYFAFWIGPKSYGAYGTKGWGKIFHGPHTHKFPEVFMHLGTDPDNPMELGAEIEMFMGPEKERHVFTKSTIICLPANFVHGPWRVLKVNRPFLIVTANQSPTHTEKAYRDMMSEDDKKRTLFIDAGYEDEGIKPAFDWPEEAGPRGDYV